MSDFILGEQACVQKFCLCFFFKKSFLGLGKNKKKKFK